MIQMNQILSTSMVNQGHTMVDMEHVIDVVHVVIGLMDVLSVEMMVDLVFKLCNRFIFMQRKQKQLNPSLGVYNIHLQCVVI